MKSHSLKLKIIFLFAVLYYLFAVPAFASEYVLPYPSYMPGHKLYRIHQFWEKFQEYWYFGHIAKFKYHLHMSDKYLVEAKTLFEYKQYLLATKALEKSNNHFQNTHLFLQKAEGEGKKIDKKINILREASQKHKLVLNQLLEDLPQDVKWQEEKKEEEELKLGELLRESILIRENW